MRRFRFGLFVAAIATALAAVAGAQDRVLVHPVEIYNAPDLKPLGQGLQAMLASRVAGSGYTVVLGDGEPAEADWSIRTTITHLGKVYSVDAALTPSSADRTGTRAYQTVTDPDDLVAALETVAGELQRHLARLVPAAPTTARSPAPVPAPAAPRTTTPPLPTAAAAGQQTAAGSFQDLLANALQNPRKAPPEPGEARAVVVADVDGDGRTEVLVLLDDAIVAFRDPGDGLIRAWEAPVPRGMQVATLSVGDVDGNGRPEVFVAGMNDTHPTSQALEWFGTTLAPKGGRVGAFLRAVDDGTGTPVLLARVPGTGEDVFSPGVYRYAWSGAAYKRDGKFPAPDFVHVLNFDLLKLAPDAPPYVVATNPGDKLVIVGSDGDRLYEGGEPVKGSRTLLVGPESPMIDPQVFRVQGKTVAWAGPDGVTRLVLYRNSGPAGRVFERIAAFGQGRLLVYRYDGLALVLDAQGPELPGFFPDVATAPGPVRPDRTVLYAPLVRNKGTFVKKPETTLLAYDLP